MKRVMPRGKKGIFFTFAAITLAIILIISFKAPDLNELKDETDVVEVRIIAMNNFVKDVEQDLEKGLQISSFRAFASMNQFIANNGSFISDIEGGFQDLVLTGILLGESPTLMVDSTFVDWADKIELQAEKLDILVNFTITGVAINQTDPWSIGIRSYVDFTVNDSKGTSSWTRGKMIEAVVSIENFEDPLYVINSNGKVTNAIVQTPYPYFVDGIDTTNLMLHTNFSYYIPASTGPSYLMRMRGDLSNSSNGIESLVNLGEFEAQGISILDRSVVDYVYFGNASTTNHRINGTPDWFKLDDDHLIIYEADNLTI